MAAEDEDVFSSFMALVNTEAGSDETPGKAERKEAEGETGDAVEGEVDALDAFMATLDEETQNRTSNGRRNRKRKHVETKVRFW